MEAPLIIDQLDAGRHAEVLDFLSRPFLCRLGIHFKEWKTSFVETGKVSPFNEKMPNIKWKRFDCRRCHKTLKWKAKVSNI